MTADVKPNEKIQAIINELFIRCRKINISLVFITVLFFCSKRCKIIFITLLDYENKQKKELQNIAINYSADIDYKGFMKIYRECTKNRLIS